MHSKTVDEIGKGQGYGCGLPWLGLWILKQSIEKPVTAQYGRMQTEVLSSHVGLITFGPLHRDPSGLHGAKQLCTESGKTADSSRWGPAFPTRRGNLDGEGVMHLVLGLPLQ